MDQFKKLNNTQQTLIVVGAVVAFLFVLSQFFDDGFGDSNNRPSAENSICDHDTSYQVIDLVDYSDSWERIPPADQITLVGLLFYQENVSRYSRDDVCTIRPRITSCVRRKAETQRSTFISDLVRICADELGY